MRIITNWILLTLAIIITTHLLPGVHLVNWQTAIIAALALGIINAVIKPILLLLTLPINLLTFGLFTFVLNALLILLVSHLVSGFQVDGFLSALLFSIIVSIVNWILHMLTNNHK